MGPATWCPAPIWLSPAHPVTMAPSRLWPPGRIRRNRAATKRPAIPTPFLTTILLSLAPAVASAGAPVSTAAAAAATQALPPAQVPEPTLVPIGATPTPRAPLTDTEAGDAAATEAAGEPQVATEIQEQSAEIDAIRQAEERSRIQEAARPEDRAAPADGLGLESPLRDRVGGALGREGAPPATGGRIALLPELDHGLAQLQAEYDIPVEVNEAVVAYVRFFQTEPVRGHFVKWLGRSHKYIEKYRAILKEEGLPEDTVFLAMIESGFGNFAYSRARAVGPWQFIAPTARIFGLKQDFWVDERRDPERSAHAAARYLKELYGQTGDWRLAWAGYNAGAGTIFRAKAKGYGDFWSMAATKGRRVLRAETKGYVPKLMAAAIITKHPEAFGFRPEEIEAEQWRDYEEETIPSATLLSVVARAAGAPERDLIELNPELRRACTPPRPYRVKIPKETADTFAANWPELAKTVRTTFAGHVVRRGDTLGKIAAQYGVPVQGILEMNGSVVEHRLRPGTELLIPRSVGAPAAVARAEPPHEPARRPEPQARVEPVRTAPPAVAEAAAQPPRTAERVAAAHESKPKTTLKVRPGDTLWSISQKYGVGLDELCRWNGIKNPHHHKLLIGTEIVVFADRT